VNLYETDKLLSEYLLFHYGSARDVLPHPGGPTGGLDYAIRCVTECLDAASLPERARALDLGCAVGRSAFELARTCSEVVGIDYSQRFIDAAQELQQNGATTFQRTEEGALTTATRIEVPPEIARERVRFERGDAMNLRPDLGTFDVVLMANLIDRLREPRRCVGRLPELVGPGGQLIITSPYTWLEEFTPRENWLGGFQRDGEPVSTLDGLTAELSANFDLIRTKDLPFLIREHARKFQWSVAQASIWRRHLP